MQFPLDLAGMQFGMLTVLCKDEAPSKQKQSRWICKCECGNFKSILRHSLIAGRSTSCGCQMHKSRKGINTTHGMSKTRLFAEWTGMKKRCLPTSDCAKHYHNRGIRVCDEWLNNFMAFYNWSVENGYNDSLSLDRINNDLGYSPDNCRWVSLAVQQSNKTNTIKINYNGTTYCLRTLCSILNFPYKTAYKRYTRMKHKNLPIDTNKLFAPINTDHIAYRYRK